MTKIHVNMYNYNLKIKKFKFLYKYLSQNHAYEMVKNGSIKIGTLYEYRQYEDNERGDNEEGVLRKYINDDYMVWKKQEDMPEFLRDRIKIKVDIRGSGGNFYISKGYSCQDVYIYCMTEKFDEQNMKDFSCDACVQISNPIAFLYEITLCIADYIDLIPKYGFITGRCVYIGREQHYKNIQNIPPFFLKEEKHSHQNEVRALWDPKKTEEKLQPIYIKCKEIKKYCTLL